MSKPASALLATGVKPREVWAWAMFDFANSGYTTVVITAIFNAYFVSVIADNQSWATLAWTSALSVSCLMIILIAPLLGAYADVHANKKTLLFISAGGCVLFTAMLGLAGPGEVWLAVAFIVLGNFCFGIGESLIAAFLPELAHEQSLGKISGWGWSLGYLGGLFSLGCSLTYVFWAQAHNIHASTYIPVTLLITAAIFAAACAPTFLYLKERAQPSVRHAGSRVLTEPFLRTMTTLKHLRHYRDMACFLLCVIFYQSGIQAVIALAAIYAQQAMGFETTETIQLILLVNVTAALGAFAFGYVQDRWGHLPTLAVTLVGWIIMILLMWSTEGRTGFWVAANIAGICLGASQSAGRALVGVFSPVSRRAEYFGLWGMAVKASSILGPMTYGAVSLLSNGDHRLAMLVTGGYFLVGLSILPFINISRGRDAALHTPAV